ncbi:hypothetical protein AA980_12890 [Neobacillus vireti]|nr:hypothetical protein AA980_12890 [Neobacillus vireti]
MEEDNFVSLFILEGKISNGSITYVDDTETALDGANVCFFYRILRGQTPTQLKLKAVKCE